MTKAPSTVIASRHFQRIFSRSSIPVDCVIVLYAGVIAPLVAGLRFGGAPAALEMVAQEWGGAFGVAMQVMLLIVVTLLLLTQAFLPTNVISMHDVTTALQGLDDVMDLIGDPMNTGKDSFQDFRCFGACVCSTLHVRASHLPSQRRPFMPTAVRPAPGRISC